MLTGLCSSLVLQGCDPMLYARARTSLVAPVDSACLKQALTSRLGEPSLRPVLEKRTRSTPAAVWLYYGHASFTQTYTDSGATLSAAEPVAQGLEVLFSSRRTVQDSVSRQLGVEILAVRDTCGGRTVPGTPELTYDR